MSMTEQRQRRIQELRDRRARALAWARRRRAGGVTLLLLAVVGFLRLIGVI
jgi:hypothetical protein